MMKEAIVKRLVEHGEDIFLSKERIPIISTGIAEADRLINDIDNYPHAFVLGCVMDRQIKAERAWFIPYAISEKLGDFSMGTLTQLSQEDVRELMSRPQPLHRFVNNMSKSFWSGVHRIASVYGSDASRIWAGKPPCTTMVHRFQEFHGIGPKIAHMAVNTLARNFKVPLADYRSIDISADVHVRRVFARLGLCSPDASVEELVDKARALHPEFPGMLDLPSWEIGRNWCKAGHPICGECYMRDLCPTARGVSISLTSSK